MEKTKQLLTNEEKIRLIREGKYSIDTFVAENEGLVFKAISAYESKYSSFKNIRDDAHSQGLCGLWKAVEAFDEEKGNLFSTVAWKYIDTEIRLVCRDYFKYKDKCLNSTLEDAPEPAVANEIIYEMLKLDLNSIKITEKQRHYYERYLELQSYVEVAKEAGVAKQTVKQAVKFVQDKLKDKYFLTK